MQKSPAAVLAIVFAFVSLVVSACAQSPQAPGNAAATPAQGNPPQPEALLRQMADYLGGLPAVSCRIQLDMRLEAQGMKNNMTTKMTMRLSRPNRLAMVLEEGMMGATVISNGQTITQYVPMLNRYTEQAAPASLAELADGSSGAMLGVPSVIIPVSGESLYKSLTEGVVSSEYVGQEKVGEVACHRLRFVRDDFSWDTWIEAGERPLVHKVVPDFSKQLAEAGGRMQGAKLEYVATFADWNTSPQFTDADFAFVPPAGAEKVDSLQEGLGGGNEGPHPLVGQPAPQFTTVNLNDEPVELAKHLGKEVVLLDFWATWCGPCVEAMPEVTAVAKKFADRGVVFYAVNVAEDPETVKEFLKANELDPPVALDADGAITQQYRADGIPQTVLIGKDGKVQVVHVGFGPNLADVLSEQIEALLAGKDLAAETLAEADEPQESEAATGGE